MRRPLLMMRTRGLTGPFFGKHVGNRASHPLAHSVGNFLSVGGETLGPELVVNGGFDSDTIWVKGDGWTIAGGVADAIGVLAASWINQPLAIQENNLYRVTYTIVAISAGNFGSQLGGTLGLTQTAAGTYTENLTAGATLDLRIRKSNNAIGQIDNVSVREVLS